jgi:hypothetical protein
MAALSDRFTPAAVEAEARSIWSAQHLPPPSGVIGSGEGTVVHELEGAFAPREAGVLVVQRAIFADADARALALAGRRAQAVLRKEDGGPPTPDPRLGPLLASLGIWVGGSGGRCWDDAPRTEGIQAIAGRLAHMGAFAVRDVSLRVCPACALARDPEGIVYQEEGGDTLLVRFAFPSADRTVSALVWTDAPWRLLGTSALLVHPDLPYVIARYRRRGAEEFVFTSRSSLHRIRGWMPGAEFEVLEEHPGKHWAGTAYQHPLRHEFPIGGGLDPPAGTILAISDVTDSGTGIVPLVPGHGGSDAQIAERLGVPGWPLVTPKGQFDIMLVHKYAGLELDSGNDFVARDLAEMGAIFANLRVRRGVPHCARCGTALIWAPARAWCLEPSRLPPDRVATYRSFLPHDRAIERLEAVPWPVSEPLKSSDPAAVTLLECSSCDRLESPSAEGDRCTCGGRRRPVRRRLLPAFEGAAAAWASMDPLPAADAVRLYLNDRRRAPAVVHHLAAMTGVGGSVRDLRLTVLPTLPEVDLAALIAEHGADAVRAAIVRSTGSPGTAATLVARCAQEHRRLERLWAAARGVLAQLDASGLATGGQPIGGFVGELGPEDRAFLARFERLRIQSLADYDRAAPALAYRRLARFLDNDLATYLAWARSRLVLSGVPPPKRAALRTLLHVLSQTTLLLAPVAPHVAESIHRALARPRATVMQETAGGVDRTLLDDDRARAWDRWLSVTRALDRFRRALHLPPGSTLPSVVLALGSDPLADPYRAEAPILERLAHVAKVEVYSPGAPWPGRRRRIEPVESEVQRVYPSRAAQILHLLRRMPERKGTDPGSGGEFTMVVNGEPTRILPSMVRVRETIPDRVVPVAWSGGEIYAEVPTGQGAPARLPPPLSTDAFRLVERVEHELRGVPGRAGPTAPEVVVVAPEALSAELAPVAPALAAYLGASRFTIAPAGGSPSPGPRIEGRTHAGARWTVQLGRPAVPARQRKLRLPGHGERIRPAYAPADVVPVVMDFSDESVLARQATVRALGQELDDLLGVPLLGPSKLEEAWARGLRSLDDFRAAPWSAIVSIPGFGPSVASALVTKLGGTVPPRELRSPRYRTASPSATALRQGSVAAHGAVAATASLPPRLPSVSLPVPPPASGDEHRIAPAAVEPAPPPAPASPPLLEEPRAAPPVEVEADSSRAIEEPLLEVPDAESERVGGPIADVPVPSADTTSTDDLTPVSAEVVVPPDATESPEASPVPPESVPTDVAPAGGSESAELPVAESEEPPLPAPETESSEAPEPIAPDAGTAGSDLLPEETRPLETGAPLEETSVTPSVPEPATLSAEPVAESVAPTGTEVREPEPVLAATPAPPAEAPAAPAGTEVPEPPPIVSAPPVLSAEDVPAIAEIPPPEPATSSPSPAETPGPTEEGALPVPPEPEPVAPPSESLADSTAPPTPEESEPPEPVTPFLAPESETLPAGPAEAGSVAEPELEAPPSPEEQVPVAPDETMAPPEAESAPSVPQAPEPAPTVAEPSPSPAPAREPTLLPGEPGPVVVPDEATLFPAPPSTSAPVEMVPAGEPAPPAPPPPSGGIELAVGTSFVPSLERFLDATAAGHQGICIVRDSPERVRAYVGSRPVEIRWLTNIGRGPTLKPTDLDGLSAFLAHALSDRRVSVFFLEGVEYLVRLHGLERVVGELEKFDALATQESARVWVHLNPKLLSPAELDRLVGAFRAAGPNG